VGAETPGLLLLSRREVDDEVDETEANQNRVLAVVVIVSPWSFHVLVLEHCRILCLAIRLACRRTAHHIGILSSPRPWYNLFVLFPFQYLVDPTPAAHGETKSLSSNRYLFGMIMPLSCCQTYLSLVASSLAHTSGCIYIVNSYRSCLAFIFPRADSPEITSKKLPHVQ
jgi:hypothetical protein